MKILFLVLSFLRAVCLQIWIPFQSVKIFSVVCKWKTVMFHYSSPGYLVQIPGYLVQMVEVHTMILRIPFCV